MEDRRSNPGREQLRSVPQIAVQDFLSEEINLEIMTYLSEGLTAKTITEKVGKPHSFVQDTIRFLRDHQMRVRGQWNIDVRALVMTKTIEFYDYTEGSCCYLLSYHTCCKIEFYD